jgi:hypothetical protein
MMAIRDYDIVVIFPAEELSAENKVGLKVFVGKWDDKEYVSLRYACAANHGKGAFVVCEKRIRKYLHDKAEAFKAFERAKQEFGSKKDVQITVGWEDNGGDAGTLVLFTDGETLIT